MLTPQVERRVGVLIYPDSLLAASHARRRRLVSSLAHCKREPVRALQRWAEHPAREYSSQRTRPGLWQVLARRRRTPRRPARQLASPSLSLAAPSPAADRARARLRRQGRPFCPASTRLDPALAGAFARHRNGGQRTGGASPPSLAGIPGTAWLTAVRWRCAWSSTLTAICPTSWPRSGSGRPDPFHRGR